MNKSTRIISLILFLLFVTINAGCMGSPPDTTVINFVKKCQAGDWSGAESMLSETGKMYFQQRETLEETYWPVLGLAGKGGITFEVVKEKLDTAVILISSEPGSTRSEVRIKINNSAFVGKETAKSIASSVGLDSLDILIKFTLVQENNRWKIELISPQGLSDMQKEGWANLAKKSPGSLGI